MIRTTTQRVMCYLMDLWGRLCLAIGRGRAPRTELSISCVGNEARACLQAVCVALPHQLRRQRSESVPASSMRRAPASATSSTKRARAINVILTARLHQLRRQRSESVPSSNMSRAFA